jgi:hypothetical protein
MSVGEHVWLGVEGRAQRVRIPSPPISTRGALRPRRRSQASFACASSELRSLLVISTWRRAGSWSLPSSIATVASTFQGDHAR